jgi:gamma-carbonic anhydrase
MENILSYKNVLPKIDPSAYVAPNAFIAGDVTIGSDCGIWFACSLRGDVNDIKIGARTNVQDNTVIHVASESQGTYIGDDVTIGHGSIIHACTIGNQSLIGMQSCILDGAKVEDRAMLAAGSLLTSGKIVPTGQLWGGRPARFMRDLRPEEIEHLLWSSSTYVELAKNYKTSAR